MNHLAPTLFATIAAAFSTTALAEQANYADVTFDAQVDNTLHLHKDDMKGWGKGSIRFDEPDHLNPPVDLFPTDSASYAYCSFGYQNKLDYRHSYRMTPGAYSFNVIESFSTDSSLYIESFTSFHHVLMHCENLKSTDLLQKIYEVRTGLRHFFKIDADSIEYKLQR